jgi:2-polyprenyl-6-methoxyphenol hydroxylase-like FAD-dependent oxidoreductase
MKGIGIVGTGIAGLHLGLFLQKHGIPATIYSDRTSEQIRASRVPSLVTRFEHTRARERELGVNHWDAPDLNAFCVYMYIGGDHPLTFRGDFARPVSAVDMRIYIAALLEDFAARGGRVVVGTVEGRDVVKLSANHDLMVVASGRASLTELFPRIPERSPYARPQRRLCGGIYRGIAFTEPRGVTYTIVPGHGEIFDTQFLTFEGLRSSMLIEAVPGAALDVVTQMRYEDDPRKFEATVLDLLREYAPIIYDRVNPQEFGLTRPLDLLQGAITPTVRRGYARLDNGAFVVAIGDVHVLNDPLLGQGANSASRSAWTLGHAILADGPFDEQFCRDVEQRIWDHACYPTEWTNAALQPPPPHAIDVFVAATQNKAIADQIIDNFNAPQRNWAIFSSPEGAESFLRQFGWNMSASPLGLSEARAA